MQNYKFLINNVGSNLYDLGIDDKFLDTKVWSMKTTEKLNLTKIKCLCTVKDIVEGTQRQVRDWEKIFVQHIWYRTYF